MSRRSDAPRVRRRRCSETMLEEVVTSFADSMEWGAGTEFSWLESFPEMAIAYTLAQCGLANIKVHPQHVAYLAGVAHRVAQARAYKNPAKAVSRELAKAIVSA